jgi:hypothetical protein
MGVYIRTLPLAACFLLSAVSLSAQPAVDPSGHWEGTVQVPDTPMKIEIDLAKNGNGVLAGTFGQPAQSIKGLPFSTVAVEGRTVRLVLKAGAAMSTFQGVISEDGKSMKGEVTQRGESAPFTLTRTGDARIAPPPKSPPIAKELAGTWNGTLVSPERQMRIILTMSNQADGTATGTIASPDGSGMEIPIAIAQKGSNVTVQAPSVDVTFVGVLSTDSTELAGTWTQGPSSLPLTFRLAKR